MLFINKWQMFNSIIDIFYIKMKYQPRQSKRGEFMTRRKRGGKRGELAKEREETNEESF